MSSPSISNEALQNLVTQFSSALDCLRELVQNSIDAGSPTIEVWTEFIPGEDDQGTIAIHVDDTGVGMDEQVIDNELTKLFASSKEDDLTKIGKFGIGFVSIFALQPHAVILRTGKGGEYWEVFFHSDRTFTKQRLDSAVEGTQITIFLQGDENRYRELTGGARGTLKKWCSHSDVEITFEDRGGAPGTGGSGPEGINEAFELSGPISVHVRREGTEMVLSYDRSPTYAFFNRGLTLAVLRDPDEVPARFRNIAFKIKSRYLEHTLSRETVLRDGNYGKAMRLLNEAADGPLQDHLVTELETLVSAPEWTLGDLDRYRVLVGFLAGEPRAALEEVSRRKLLRTADGQVTSLEAIWETARREGRIFVSQAPGALVDMLAEQGLPVLLGRPEDLSLLDSWPPGLDPVLGLVVGYIALRRKSKLMRRLLDLISPADYLADAARLIADPETVYLALIVDEAPPADEARLIQRAEQLLDSVGAGYRELQGCRLQAPAEHPPLFLIGRKIAPMMAVPPRAASLGAASRPRRPRAAVNRDHPQFRALLALQERAPGLAAYCLAKDLLLAEDRLLSRDAALLELAIPAAAREAVS